MFFFSLLKFLLLSKSKSLNSFSFLTRDTLIAMPLYYDIDNCIQNEHISRNNIANIFLYLNLFFKHTEYLLCTLQWALSKPILPFPQKIIMQKNEWKVKFPPNWIWSAVNVLDNCQLLEDLVVLSSAKGSISETYWMSKDTD